MTKLELVNLIKKNFTKENGTVDISGMDFGDLDVNISAMKTKGDIYQNFHKTPGHILQNYHEAGGDIFQNSHKTEGNIFQCFHKKN